MIGYLGTPGLLAQLPYKGGLSVEHDRPVSFTRTLGGKRKAFRGRASRREWSVSVDLTGSSMAQGIVAVASMPGPLGWYPADATAGNLFSPQAAGFNVIAANATDAGLVALPDGSIARSVSHTGSGVVYVGTYHGSYERVPVIAGQRVSVGVWAFNGGRITGSWRDSAGAAVGSVPDSGTVSFSGWQWVSATFTVPFGATQFLMALSAGAQYARPSVTWGARAVDRPGRGCPAAVVSGLSEELTVIRPDDAYGSVSFTVTEVG